MAERVAESVGTTTSAANPCANASTNHSVCAAYPSRRDLPAEGYQLRATERLRTVKGGHRVMNPYTVPGFRMTLLAALVAACLAPGADRGSRLR